MDSLEKLVSALSESEQRTFRIQLVKTVRSKEVIKLYNALASGKEWKPSELRNLLYTKRNADKYYNTRRRLGEFVKRFIHEHFQEDVHEPEGKLHQLLAVARIMLKRRNYQAAQAQLGEVRQMAEAHHFYDVLANVYTLQLAHAEHLGEDVAELMELATSNLGKLELLNKLNMAFVLIRKQLAEYRKAGLHFDTELTIRQVLSEVKFQRRDLLNNPVFVLRLMELVRTVVVSSKDYGNFKPYLIKAYNLLSENKAFTGANASLEGEFLYMLSHVHYRMRNFAEAEKWLVRLQSYLSAAGYAENMKANALMIEAGISFYGGNADGGIAILESGIQRFAKVVGRREHWNMQLNLTVYLFFKGEYRKCVRHMNAIPNRTKELEAELGKEWFFKRDMIEVIFQYENKNAEGARSKLVTVLKNYSAMLQEPNYRRAKTFLEFVLFFFDYPERIDSPEFLERVKTARAGWRDQPEDLQAIVFFSWLRSKMAKRPVYAMLLERVNELKVKN